MRVNGFAYGLGALALLGLVYAAAPANAATTKMGCVKGKEMWDAKVGKCVPGKPKAKAASKAPKKAAEKKKG
jgi:hypothetical protein